MTLHSTFLLHAIIPCFSKWSCKSETLWSSPSFVSMVNKWRWAQLLKHIGWPPPLCYYECNYEKNVNCLWWVALLQKLENLPQELTNGRPLTQFCAPSPIIAGWVLDLCAANYSGVCSRHNLCTLRHCLCWSRPILRWVQAPPLFSGIAPSLLCVISYLDC